MSNNRFFADLPAQTDFISVLDRQNYRPAPEDWTLLVTDVRNSTDAIRSGQYRAVNMVGASCITAALNSCPGMALPFVFGGDGATLLVPESAVAQVVRGLQGVAAMARTQFSLDLRIGQVAVRELRKRGFVVEVAKYSVGHTDNLAMLRGSGLAEAEHCIKSSGGNHLIPADNEAPDANLEGLSCRWEPLRSTRGEILTLLVQSRHAGTESDGYYRDFYARLGTLSGLHHAVMNPVKTGALRVGWPPTSLGIEMRTHAGSGKWLTRITSFLHASLHSLAGYVAFNTGWRTPLLDPARYKKTMIAHSDFRKFDGLLRMVIDVPQPQIPDILELLESEHRQGAIFYGVHRSPSALMTCVVFSLKQDSHVHFIDGDNGGYALAAVRLKEQMKAAASRL